jgi:hypothetical protein
MILRILLVDFSSTLLLLSCFREISVILGVGALLVNGAHGKNLLIIYSEAILQCSVLFRD